MRTSALLFPWMLAGCAAPTAPTPALPTLEGRLALPGDGDAVRFVQGRIRFSGAEIVEVEAVPGDPSPDDLTITAGFVDGHAHPLGLGLGLTRLDLGGVDSYAKALLLVENAPPGEGWLQGRGWDQNRWADAPAGGWPLAADLDLRTKDRPAFLRRVDGHAAWVNGAALRLAKIDARTPDPPGGRIVRGEDGAPTGVLIDTAMDLVPVPPPAPSEIQAALLAAQGAMLTAGLVGVHDMGVDDATLAAWRALDADGRLIVHVAAFLTPESEAARILLERGPERGRRLEVVGIKAYADGALGSRGAHLSSPYADDPSTSGLRILGTEAIADLATRCLRARAILAVHAIGDQAVTEVLDGFAAARAAVPGASDVPLRLEHAQIVKPEDRGRFRALGVIASMQPTHATSDMPWAPARLGPTRIDWAYAWRDLKQAGATLVLGSDFPVERHEPALGVWAGVRRQDLRRFPPEGWRPDQALTEGEVVHGFTAATWAALGDLPRGKLAPGSEASFTVWRGDLGQNDPPGWTAVQTWVAGERRDRPAE